MIENAAVFVNGSRVFKGVNVEVTDTEVVVLNRVNGGEMKRYSVINVAKEGMAWDIPIAHSQEPTNELMSLVVQQGCGCSGMLPYMTDSGYTGPFARVRR